MPKRLMTLQVNGRTYELAVADHELLVDVLRDGLLLTGTKQGCDGGECGACTVLIDSQPRLACITLAATVQGRAIETIEGLVGRTSSHERSEGRIPSRGDGPLGQGGRTSPHGRSEGRVPPRGDGPQGQGGRISALQQAFHEKLGTQCGFCTPGMVMAAEALLRREPNPSEAQIREALAGNLCRCTGYVKIVESVQAAALATAGAHA
jgi:4-hydroxybenzoyl-CoA reductase subunit gamma